MKYGKWRGKFDKKIRKLLKRALEKNKGKFSALENKRRSSISKVLYW
jgi:hypothetical protein